MLKLHFLNVENGDCTVVEHIKGDLRTFGVIDCNRTNDRSSPARDKLVALGAEKLEFVCITHPDKDHYSGIFDVLTHFDGKISQFITFPLGGIIADKERLSKYLSQIAEMAMRGDDEILTKKYLEFMQIMKWGWEKFRPRDQWIEVTGDYDLLGFDNFEGVEFYGIMPPRRVKGEFVATMLGADRIPKLDNNEISTALLLRYAGRTIILGGDATRENWDWHRKYRARSKVSILSDITKLPHHGSRKDNPADVLEAFFEKGRSSIAIISADGRRHPDLETFRLLDDLETTRYCTNVCNPNERQLKRLYKEAKLDSRLEDYLNIFADPIVIEPKPCKGDICIEIGDDGSIVPSFEFNTICNCTRQILSQNLAPAA